MYQRPPQTEKALKTSVYNLAVLNMALDNLDLTKSEICVAFVSFFGIFCRIVSINARNIRTDFGFIQ